MGTLVSIINKTNNSLDILETSNEFMGVSSLSTKVNITSVVYGLLVYAAGCICEYIRDIRNKICDTKQD